MNKKSFIFSLDALIAIFIISILLASLFFYLSKSVTYTEVDLYRISTDSLTVLEKNKVLEKAVENNNIAVIQNFLNAMPNQICSNLTIYDKNLVNLMTITKVGCLASDKKSSAKRAFIFNFESYISEMNSWYK